MKLAQLRIKSEITLKNVTLLSRFLLKMLKENQEKKDGWVMR